MNETTPMAATPYDYATAQRILGQKYALAQALINAQSPAPGYMNRANIGGSEYSFYRPNTAGMISSALQKALGAYALNKTNQAAQQDTQQQNSAIQQALAGLRPSVTGSQDVSAPLSASQQSNLAAANAPDAKAPGLSGIDTSTVPMQVPVVSGPSSADVMNSVMQLERAGPMGQGIGNAIMQRQFAPPKTIALSPGQKAYTYDPFTGQPISTMGNGGPDPKMAPTYLQLLTNADVTNPQGYQTALTAARGLGLIGANDNPSPTDLAAIQNGARQSQAAKTYSTQQQGNESGARTTFIQGPQTADTYAKAGESNASAAATRQGTALKGAGAVESANNDVATLNYNLARTEDGLNIIKQLEAGGGAGGKIPATLRDAETFFGSNPKWAAARSYIAQANVQSMINLLHNGGRLGQNEFKILNTELENKDMPLETLKYLFSQTAALMQSQLFNARNFSGQASAAANASTPGLHTAPANPAPVPQISNSTPPVSMLKPGVVTHFADGTSWALGPNGQPVQVQ